MNFRELCIYTSIGFCITLGMIMILGDLGVI